MGWGAWALGLGWRSLGLVVIIHALKAPIETCSARSPRHPKEVVIVSKQH